MGVIVIVRVHDHLSHASRFLTVIVIVDRDRASERDMERDRDRVVK